MSIVSLLKVTFYGHMDDRRQVLTDLQTFGCLHLIPLSTPLEPAGRTSFSSKTREALRFLETCPGRRRQVTRALQFDPVEVETRTLNVKDGIGALEDERDALLARMDNLAPWGQFEYPNPEELAGYRLWFYKVPHKDMAAVSKTDLVWEQVYGDGRFAHIVVISKEEPEGMPADRVRTGNRTLAQLEERLEEVAVALEDLYAERIGMTRWYTLFKENVKRLEDHGAVLDAVDKTWAEDKLFALQAWAPKEDISQLGAYAEKRDLVFETEAPSPDETPPTLMKNPGLVAGGQDLVSFYTTPRYWLWDPSTLVFLSFAVFFAMIFADAGYAAVLGVVTVILWKKLGGTGAARRFRTLLTVMVGTCLIYGVLVGSYFGVSPENMSILGQLKIIDMMDFDFMMQFSILLGVLHLILANGVTAWHYRGSMKALKPLAWGAVFLGGAFLWQGMSRENAPGFFKLFGGMVTGLGLLGVLLFTETRGAFWKRLLKGLSGLTGISSAFSDALSYLRLFALGLASASLAATFNSMSGQVRDAVPGIGILFALLIGLLGHTLNFVLAVASGFIHGLRLNFIEFFRWSISEEGTPFKAFARKER